MKDIHEVLRRKQARYAQLAKQIEMLQMAAEKLRERPVLVEECRGIVHAVRLLAGPDLVEPRCSEQAIAITSVLS